MELDISPDAFTLLRGLVAATKTTGRREFTAERRGGKARLQGIEVDLEFARLDLTELVEQGYARIDSDSRRFFVTSVTLRGNQLVEQFMGVPTVVAEQKLNLTLARVRRRAPSVADSLDRAFELAVSAGTQEQISEVGHNCRLALQDALDVLYQEAELSGEAKTSTKGRLEALIEHQRPNKTDRLILQNLESACAASATAYERGEHRSEKDARPLENEDALDMVLLTYVAVSQAFRWF